MLAVLYYGRRTRSCRSSSGSRPGARRRPRRLGRRLGGVLLLREQLRLLQQDLRQPRRRITFLIWLWLTNIAILFGQELNAEIERGRELAAGKPAIDDIQLPLRDKPKKDPEEQAAQISRDAVAEQETTDGNGGAKHDEAVAQLGQSSSPQAGARALDRPS